LSTLPPIKNKIALLKQELQKSTTGAPTTFRLFLLLAVLVVTIILGVIAILIVTGTFTAGLSENERIVENELIYVSQNISQEYGQLSLQTVEFSKALSDIMEEKMNKLGISAADLQDHPEMLEEIVSVGYEQAFFSLQLAKSSGAFFVLDATVNPALDDAQSSRAGLYLKNMEPNIVNSLAPNIIVLRGFPSISRTNSLPLHAQWKMEFDINNIDAPYYHRPIDAANLNPELPLSRLYYWSPAFKLPGTSEDIMLCSVPLIDSRGHVFGVCGLEISAMLFKLSNMPHRGTYQRMFCVFSPLTENKIDLQKSMFAGGYSAKMTSKGNTTLKISDQGRSFCSYKQSQDHSFLGLHKPINLYAKDSAFSDEEWVAALMIPEGDVVSSITQLNLMLIFLLTILVLLGIVAAYFLSRNFLKPIFEGLDIIKSENLSEAPRTQIPEINDLIDFLKVHNEELYEKAKQENLSLSSLDEFLENTEKLTPSERLVFDHYVKGYTPKETAEELFLSINTIKTHNKRIYTKLNVKSRDELLLYVKLLKEIGKEIVDQGDQGDGSADLSL
jgi:DNA-binding CsgD family transcriptional regulator/uncharacterized protein YneF (UPF0154 family)